MNQLLGEVLYFVGCYRKLKNSPILLSQVSCSVHLPFEQFIDELDDLTIFACRQYFSQVFPNRYFLALFRVFYLFNELFLLIQTHSCELTHLNVTKSNLMVNIHSMQCHFSQTKILIFKKYLHIFVDQCCMSEIINDEFYITHLFALCTKLLCLSKILIVGVIEPQSNFNNKRGFLLIQGINLDTKMTQII